MRRVRERALNWKEDCCYASRRGPRYEKWEIFIFLLADYNPFGHVGWCDVDCSVGECVRCTIKWMEWAAQVPLASQTALILVVVWEKVFSVFIVRSKEKTVKLFQQKSNSKVKHFREIIFQNYSQLVPLEVCAPAVQTRLFAPDFVVIGHLKSSGLKVRFCLLKCLRRTFLFQAVRHPPSSTPYRSDITLWILASPFSIHHKKNWRSIEPLCIPCLEFDCFFWSI